MPRDRLQRELFELLPFGSGRRSCPEDAARVVRFGAGGGATASALFLRGELPDEMKPSELRHGDVLGSLRPR
ncbi:hypothetical protein J5N97_030013 [Dioscorea zingiberensis]|uniref:Uncharacterized protein n=1 Tax=Dioscorea zingiberensis TaxID=325984 RepID=A0A9D5BX09_9LILI|nr:hypothetical protein J5N97_030013 [Dioscorea zingiberensis]